MPQSILTQINYDPADLRHRLSLYRTLYDAQTPWTTPRDVELVAEVWAGIVDLSSIASTQAEQQASTVELVFVIRHRADLANVSHLVFDGERYDLLTLHDPDQRRRWLHLKVRKALGA